MQIHGYGPVSRFAALARENIVPCSFTTASLAVVLNRQGKTAWTAAATPAENNVLAKDRAKR
jgi:hypothetical protein